MKKVLLTFAFFAFVLTNVIQAQLAAGYAFSSSTGTYTEITGGALLGTETNDDQRFVDPAVPAGGTTLTGVGLPIGFNFVFDGNTFDVFAVNANGWISLGNSTNTPAVDITSTSGTTPLGSTSAITPPAFVSRIALFSRDLNGQTGAELRYETIGTAPNRVLVVQWKNYRKYNVTGDSFNGQIQLYETTNEIKLVYGTMTNNATSGTFQVGLRGAPATTATNYANRTTTTDWSNSSAGSTVTSTMTISSTVFPANGLTYTWTPLTCFAPSNILVSNITTTSADFTWTAPSTGTPNSYEWKVVLAGAGSGGTAVSSGTETHPDVTASATGLNVVTNYHFYVRTFCGGTDYSGWAGPIAFTTLCNATNVPYFEGFEGISANNELPQCMAATALGTKNLTYIAATTYNRTPKSGAKFAAFQYAPAGNWFFFAPVQLTGGVSYDATVWYITDGASGFTALNIAYGDAQLATSMTQITTVANPTNTTYQKLSGAFTPATTGVYFLGIQAEGTSTSPWYLTIDDISIELTPTCPGVNNLAVQNLTSTSADLSWNETGTATTWNVEWGLEGFTQGNGTLVSTTSNPYSLNGLLPNTSYSFYVQSDCGAGDISGWSGPFTFHTPCLAISSFPFSESFDGTTFAPDCWLNVNTAGSTSGKWDRQTSGSNPACTPHSGTAMARFNCYSLSTGTKGNLITPTITFPTDNYQVSFWMYRDNGYLTNTDLVNVYYNTTDNLTGATLLGTINRSINLTPVVTANGWYEYIFEMPTGISGNSFIIFEAVSAFGNNIFIDDVMIDVIPTCPGVPLLSMSSSNPTLNSIDLAWTEPGTATEWQLEYGNTGFTPGTGTVVLANSNPYTLTGLNPSTIYDVYIRSICAVGDTSLWKGPFKFNTECGTFTATIIEKFDNVTTPALPLCWSKIVVSTSTAARVQTITTSTPESTPNHVELYNSSTAGATTYLMLVTPELTDLTTGPNQLRFKAKRGASAENLIIGTLSDPTDGSTFTLIDTIKTLTNTYQEFTIPFHNYNGTDTYIAFKHGNSAATRYVYIDDFNWEPMPSCPGITQGTFIASNPTLNSIDLAWSEWLPASEWEIEYGISGFTPGTGFTSIVTSNPTTISGLTPSTTYQIYIRSICAVGDTSAWYGPVTFSTSCGTFNATMLQNFDGVSTPNLPLCWSKIIVATTTSTFARVQTITTSSPFSTPNQIEMYNSATAGAFTYVMLVSPEMTDIVGNNRLRFMAKRGTNATDLIIGTLSDPTDGSTFTALQTFTLTNTFDEYIVDFDTYAGTDVHFAFKHGNTGATQYIYIDNVIWEPIPSCLELVYNTIVPSNPTTNSIDLAWTYTGTATEFQIEYGLFGFTQGTGMYAIANSNPYTLNGLQHSKTYQAYVRAICAPGDTSMWRGPVTFSTLCGAWALPYTEDFTGTAIDAIPACWDRNYNNWGVDTTDFAGGISPEMVLNWTPSVTDTVLVITPEIDATNATSLYLQFNHFVDNYDGNPYAIGVLISNDNGATWDSLWAVIPTDHIGPEVKTIDISSYAGDIINIAFAFFGNTFDINYWYIDNVIVDEIPACDLPTVLTATGITPTTADLGWTGAGDTWEIEFDTTGFVPTNGNLVVTTDNPYTLDGLLPETSYDFYVRAHCLFDSTTWAGPFTFTTADSCFTPSNITAQNIISSAADILFGSNETLWEIEFDTNGFTPGTGYYIITDDNPYSLTGLAPGTVYDIYVRAICDSVAGDYSDWAGPYTFTTDCDVVNTFPWTDQFDNAVAPDIFPCWNTMTAGGETWFVGNLQAQFGTQYAAITNGGQITQDEYLITPHFDFSFLAHPYVAFWWALNYEKAVAPDNDFDFYLLITTDDGITIDTLWSENDEGVFNTFEWYETMIDLTAYAGEPDVQIGFNLVGLNGSLSKSSIDAAVDKVTVHDSTTVNINTLVSDLNVNIHPNPSNGLFNVQMLSNTENLIITVYNLQGQIVYAEKLAGVVSGTVNKLDLKSLPAGMYYLQLNDGKTILNKKITIN